MRVNARVFLYLGQMFELVHCYIENTSSNIQTVAKSSIAPKDNVMKDHHEEDDLNKNSGVIVNIDNKEYKPDWADLDTRLLPEWYDKAKIGILVHWGAFHMPSFHSKWFWHDWRQGGIDENCEKFVKYNYPQAFTYQDIPIFQAEFFEPKRIAKMFAMSGAKYVVLTSKHHDGFALYPSKRSQKWNSVDIGPRRDLVGDFARAIKKLDLKFGVYYSLYEWLNPLYLSDQEANFTTNIFPTHKIFPEIKQLVTDYQPSVLWSDGDWQAPDSYWNSTEILAWLYSESSVKEEIVVNDRWGQGIRCQHGDFFDCADKYKPGELPEHKWENVFTLDKESWSYNKKMSFFDVLTIRQLLYEVITTVSCGGS